MPGTQRAALEAQARSVLAGMGISDVTVVDPRVGRPEHARLEIGHPRLAGYRRSEWWDRTHAMHSDGTAAGVMLEIALMTWWLRDAGIRATADYDLGTLVVSSGGPPNIDMDELRQSLSSRAAGNPVPDESALLAWAGLPASDVDGMTPALRDVIGAIAPSASALTRSAETGRRRAEPEPPVRRTLNQQRCPRRPGRGTAEAADYQRLAASAAPPGQGAGARPPTSSRRHDNAYRRRRRASCFTYPRERFTGCYDSGPGVSFGLGVTTAVKEHQAWAL